MRKLAHNLFLSFWTSIQTLDLVQQPLPEVKKDDVNKLMGITLALLDTRYADS